MKKKIAGILIIVLSIGMLGFWELWGRENLSYRTVAVLKESCEAHTMLTEEHMKSAFGVDIAIRTEEVNGQDYVAVIPLELK